MFPLIINTFKLFFGDTNDSPPQLDLGNRIVGWASESHLFSLSTDPRSPSGSGLRWGLWPTRWETWTQIHGENREPLGGDLPGWAGSRPWVSAL